MSPKKYLRLFLINLGVLWALTQIIPDALKVSHGLNTLASAAFILMLVNLIVRPIFNLLLLPINLLTLGSFRWVINVASLYLVTLLVPTLTIQAFHFSGFTWHGFVFPSLSLSTFWAYVAVSFLLSFLTSLVIWLIH